MAWQKWWNLGLNLGTGFSLSPRDFPAVSVGVVAAEADGALVRLTLDAEMTPDVRYEVIATGVADLAGNAVLAPFDRATLHGFRPARPEARRFDLWSMLPKHNRREDRTGDLWRFIACLQEVTDLLLAEVDRFPHEGAMAKRDDDGRAAQVLVATADARGERSSRRVELGPFAVQRVPGVDDPLGLAAQAD